jgi:hypothetical protein
MPDATPKRPATARKTGFVGEHVNTGIRGRSRGSAVPGDRKLPLF